MKLSLVFITVAALLASTASAGALRNEDRKLQDGVAGLLENIDFGDIGQLASFNGLNAAEQILANVNEHTDLPKLVDGNSLLDIAKRIVDGDASIANPDETTAKILDLLKQAVAKLFPNVDFVEVIKRVIPLIPAVPQSRHLQDGVAGLLENIDFGDIGQLASFNGLNAAEQILANVNEHTDLPKLVDGNSLLDIAKRIVDGDASIANPDETTAKILDLLKQAVAKLFPNVDFVEVIKRVIPLIPTA